jgi:hypothetical protein
MAPSKKDIARLQSIIKAATSLLDELTQGESKKTSARGATKKVATKAARTPKKPASPPRKASATKRKARK